jgi:hypothetical protein
MMRVGYALNCNCTQLLRPDYNGLFDQCVEHLNDNLWPAWPGASHHHLRDDFVKKPLGNIPIHNTQIASPRPHVSTHTNHAH